MPTKVTLRQRPISNGRVSLYLDFYPPIADSETGKPKRREYLSMFVPAKPRNSMEREAKRETLSLAEGIRHKREAELNKADIYTALEAEQVRAKERAERDFIAYFKAQADRREDANRITWVSSLNYLEAFTGGAVKFGDLTEDFCERFKNYLLTTGSTRSN